MKANDITAKQKAILDFMKKVQDEKGYPPTVREIGAAVGLQSPSSVQFHLNALAEKGYLTIDGKTNRKYLYDRYCLGSI